MPINPEPPFVRPPYSSDTDNFPPGRRSGGKVKRTAEPSPSTAKGKAGKHTPLRARNITPVIASPTVNAKAVAKANYIQQLRKTSVLQAQVSLINHIPALKRLGGDPAGIPANPGFSISYNDKGTLISVIPPDERLRANPQKYNEIKTKLIRKLEQIENQYKGVQKQALYNKVATAEEQLRTSKVALTEARASTPVVDYTQFMVSLGSMTTPMSDVRPAHTPSHSGRAAAARPGEFMLEHERRRRSEPVSVGSGVSGGFKLDQSDADRVRFISAEEMALLDRPSESCRFLQQTYLGFRREDASWLANTPFGFHPSEPTDFERIAYSNSNHQVLKKFKVQLQSVSGRDYLPGDEILVVKDTNTNQLKLVRAGSFDGEDVGGGGFPGYSRKGAERAFEYLKNRVDGNQKPYQHLQAGSSGNLEAWSCGFNSLQVAIFMATGTKVPFSVIVAAAEDELDKRPKRERERIRKNLNDGHYGFGTTYLQILLGDTSRYKAPPFGEAYNGYVLLGTESGSNHYNRYRKDYNTRCDTKVLTRSEIENHDFTKAGSVIVGQGAFSYAVYRIKGHGGSHQYVVYDPHNFQYEPDYFTNPNKGGLKVFNSKQEAFRYISTQKRGRSQRGQFDGFYRLPDIILQDIQKNMMKSKSNWERRVIV